MKVKIKITTPTGEEVNREIDGAGGSLPHWEHDAAEIDDLITNALDQGWTVQITPIDEPKPGKKQ